MAIQDRPPLPSTAVTVATSEGMPAQLFRGDSQMHKLMAGLDWSSTDVGPVEQWPEALRSAVSICLGSRFPICMTWGPTYTTFYNDAYVPMLGEAKHPYFLGRSFKDCWPEIWDVVGPMIDSVLESGDATYSEDLPLFMKRHDYLEETYFTFSYSPITAGNGVGGMFCAVTETTERVLSERRLRALRELAAATADATDADDACRRACAALVRHSPVVPFALCYLLDSEGHRGRLAACTGIAPGHDAAPDEIHLEVASGQPWPLQEALTLGGILAVPVEARWSLPGGPWPDTAEQAIVAPLLQSGTSLPAGFLVAGVNARRRLDEGYGAFFDSVQAHLGTAIATAREREAERTRAEALAELDRAKTAFFSNVSHEFRTPLTLLLGPLEDALSDAANPLPPAQRRRHEVALRNARRLLRLVNTLLDFSRLEAGRIQALFEATDLPSYTAELAATFRSAVEHAGLSLIIECPPLPNGGTAYVDREMWEKIVLNLLSNALKFTFAGEISVRVESVDDQIELRVRDTGEGIDPAELPRLFERFHRVQGVRSRTHEGTGIGLALVHELVRLHGGEVRVESALGKGSTFTVSIPSGAAHLPAEQVAAESTHRSSAPVVTAFLEDALSWLPEVAMGSLPEDAEPLTSRGPRPEVPSGRPRVLLVDDNRDMRDYVTRLLRERYDVEAVADGMQALASARSRPPSLVLSDIMLPGKDGLALLSDLRQDERTRELPIILLSARAGSEAQIEGLARGADDYLVKPFSARELLARVQTHIELYDLRRTAAERERRARVEALDMAADQARLREELQRERDALTATVAELTTTRHRLEGKRQVLEHIVEGRPLAETLEVLARHVESVCPRYRCSILLLDDDRIHLRHATAPHLPAAYCQAIDGVEIGEAVGSCGTAAYRGQPVITRDIATDPLWEGYRELALAHGLRSCWSTPIASASDGVLGTFALYCEEPIDPSPDEIDMVAALAQFAAIAVERHGLEQEREGAKRQKEDFLAAAAHDLRTPLTAISGHVQLLQRQLLRQPDAAPSTAAALSTIKAATERAVVLIDELLDASRLEATGVLELRLSATDLLAIVHRVAATHQRGTAIHDITVTAAMPMLTGLWDATRLERAVDNLVGNAVKYSPDGGPIVLRVASTQDANGEWACLTVEDQGLGIAAADRERIFQRFQRGINVRDKIAGSGVGLSYVREIARLHGGTLTVVSQEGRGSAFTLMLPLKPRPPHEAP